MSLTSFVHDVISKIETFFTSGKAQQVETQLAALVQQAVPIVEEINQLIPNKTLQEVTAAYEKYAVPMATQVQGDPTSIGNAMLNLATSVLQKNHAPTAAVSLLNTAVQLALLTMKK